MKGRLLTGLLLAATLTLAIAPVARAQFGLLPEAEGFDVSVSKVGGAPANAAGSHPFAFHAHVGLQSTGPYSDGDLRELELALPAGFLVNPASVEECSAALFRTPRVSPFEESAAGESCPNRAQIGTLTVTSAGVTRTFGLFNLTPPYGSPAALGAAPFGVPVVLTPRLREADAGLTLELRGLSQAIDVGAIELEIWGAPWALEHDGQRGNCLNESDPGAYHGVLGEVIATGDPKAPLELIPGTCTVPQVLAQLEDDVKSFLTLPTTPCGEPMSFSIGVRSWDDELDEATLEHRGSGGDPVPLSQCNQALTDVELALTTDRAAVGTGLRFTLEVKDGGGILNPKGIARPAIRRAFVALPQGLTINPSVGAGLGVCTESQFARESASSAPGEGCPNSSKLGTTEALGMIGSDAPVAGSLYLAKPHANPYGSMLALYITVASPERDIFQRSVGKLVPDPATGQLTATFENLPRLLYTRFELRLREGQRALLLSPPTCGTYAASLELTSWADSDPPNHEATSFLITQGQSGACPAGLQPFSPGLEAGSLNPNAAFYTPYLLRMTRTDPEQQITSYSATFPPGLLGKIAGIPYCPDTAIAAAKTRSGVEELERPSCPRAADIGGTLAGYGVGGTLAYAPGRLYLAGPYNGAPLSVVAIDSALVGPFDLGVVVVRSAIRVDPRTARVSVDSLGSDPIPHMLEGIPLHIRDIRVHVDRPGLMLNPTSCDPLQSVSTLTGAGIDLSRADDDVAATSTDRYQLLNCQGLGFRPRLSLKLLGAKRRGGNPALRAVLTERPGDANLATAAVTLPASQFLAQNHIRGICQARQFDAGHCPPDSVYGNARVFTPLLAEPLQGPVYLRSSEHRLPDMVAALRGAGGIAIDVVGRISSRRGAMRASFDVLPDAPVTKFVMTLKGGRNGLLENSQSLCRSSSFATVRFTGHNNAAVAARVKLGNQCREKKRHRKAQANGKGGKGR